MSIPVRPARISAVWISAPVTESANASTRPGGGAVSQDVDALNEWVYAELFLTPSSDPWLGLAPRDVYTALDGGGQFVASDR